MADTDMLNQLDAILRCLLRLEMTRPASEVDIVFEQPTREWSARCTSTVTVNLFLYDLRENARLRAMSPRFESGQTADGKPGEKRTEVRLDAHYALTVWSKSKSVDDERAVTNEVLSALLRHPKLPSKPFEAKLNGFLDVQYEAWKKQKEKEEEGQVSPKATGNKRALLVVSEQQKQEREKADAEARAQFKNESEEMRLLTLLQQQPVPITLQVAQNDVLEKPTDLWGVLSNDIRPTIPITVTFALNPFEVTETWPVREAQFGFMRREPDPQNGKDNGYVNPAARRYQDERDKDGNVVKDEKGDEKWANSDGFRTSATANAGNVPAQVLYVRGVVKPKPIDAPLTDLRVYLPVRNKQLGVDSDGEFTVFGLPAGIPEQGPESEYELEISAQRSKLPKTRFKLIVSPTLKDTLQVFQLYIAGYVCGVVKPKPADAPLQALRVYLPTRQTQLGVDEDGEFGVAGLPDGEYVLDISAQNSKPPQQPFKLVVQPGAEDQLQVFELEIEAPR